MTRLPLTIAAAAIALAGCETIADIPTDQLGSGNFILSNGVPAGTAQLLGNGDTVSLAVALVGLTPGQHGFHLHTTGDCTRPDFTSAGGHLNPAGKGHGINDADGAHLGDLPNLTVAANGTATATFELRGTRSALTSALFDADGTAVVVHADPDDGTSEPAGNAGSRVACAVLTQG